MCGFAAVLGLARDEALPAARRMLAALRHRGPDGEGLEVVEVAGRPPVVLAHARLAILDPRPRGRQPMHLSGARAPQLVFNGEVYNYRELREELGGEGWTTDTDTEVVLHAYERWGTDPPTGSIAALPMIRL